MMFVFTTHYKMLRFTLLSTFFLCAYGATLPFVPHFDERIVGGETAYIDEFPFHVALIRNDHYFCGGSIINERVIVTAAHCTQHPASTYVIRAGSTHSHTGGQIVSVAKIINHEHYGKPTRYNNDISLLFLTTELTLDEEYVAKVTLPAQGQHVADGTNSVAIGWGRTSEGGHFPPFAALQKVTIPIVNQHKCADSYKRIFFLPPVTDNMICAGNFDHGGQDGCQGDSGGSLTVDKVLIGITSWGYGCARPKYPGVWTRVPNYIDWINEHIN